MTTRIKPNTRPDTKSQQHLDNVKKTMGNIPNMFATLAHSPAALECCMHGITALKNTHLSETLRDQIALAVAGANGCEYCASAHTAIGKTHKLSPSEMSQNLRGKSSDPKTQAVLTFTWKVIESRGKVSDSDLKTVHDAGCSDADIIEIVAVTCQNIFTNYINNVACTEVDFPKVSVPSEHEVV